MRMTVSYTHLDVYKRQIIPDANTAFQAYMNGEVDDLMLNIPSNEIAGLKADPDYTVYERASNNRTYLTLSLIHISADILRQLRRLFQQLLRPVFSEIPRAAVVVSLNLSHGTTLGYD